MFKPFFDFLNLFEKRYKVYLFILFICSIISGLFELAGVALIFPFMAIIKNPEIIQTNQILSYFYNLFGFTDYKHMIYMIALLMGSTFIFKNLYMLTNRYIEFRFIVRWKNRVVRTLMEKYISFPMEFHLKRNSSSLMQILGTEVSHMFQHFVLQIIIMFSNLIIALTLLSLIIYLFFVPAIIAGSILLILMSIQILIVRKLSKTIRSGYMNAKEQDLSVLQKSIFAIRESKTFLKEKSFVEEYSQSSKKNSHYDHLMIMMNHLPVHVTEIVLITAVLTMACLILAQNNVPQEDLTNLALLAIVAFRIAPTINRFLNSYSLIKASQQSVIDITKELKLSDRGKENIEPQSRISFKKEIALKDISFSYDNEQKVLDKINLKIPKGAFYGIIGASGAGKSTLVDILMGLLTPDKGKITCDNIIINSKNSRSYRANIGYVPQSPFLLPESVRRNVAFGEKEEKINDEKVIDVLKKTHLYDFFISKKNGLDTTLGEHGKKLSGGQKQRIAIARALYIDPSIIILDEATSALDVETEQDISNTIASLKGDKTIIAIAHRLSTLKKCDKIIYMKEGKIFDIGTFKELHYKHSEFKKLIELSSIKLENE